LAEKSQTPDEKLQREFNRWAQEGEGEKMEHHHLNITEKTIRLMDLRPGERVLDLGADLAGQRGCWRGSYRMGRKALARLSG